MPDLTAAANDLRAVLGDFLARDRQDGVFEIQVGGPGSVPELADLDQPELHLDVLPGDLNDGQKQGLAGLGYIRNGAAWDHPGGWRLVLPDQDTGWQARQQALRALLLANAGARTEYRAAYLQAGREAADTALAEAALAHYARTVGFGPALYVAEVLRGLDVPWMFAAGMALDLHLGRVTRPHDDLDVVLPREAQEPLREALAGWRLDACVDGTYCEWTAPLEPPHHQVHGRYPNMPMLDLMLSDLSGGLWHYRRDPAITLPLTEARRIGPHGLPYLAPHAALLFKSGSSGRPRPKDEQDFVRVLPSLSDRERDWLRQAIAKAQPQHPWLTRL